MKLHLQFTYYDRRTASQHPASTHHQLLPAAISPPCQQASVSRLLSSCSSGLHYPRKISKSEQAIQAINMCSADCLLVIIAIIFPPLPVWVKRGLCSADSLINIALCCLGFLPGLIHAWYIISVTPDEYEYQTVPNGDVERDGNVSYYYVTCPHATPPSHGAQQANQANYGTTGPMQTPAQGPSQHGQAGPSGDVPPSYTDAVKGDNKIQKK